MPPKWIARPYQSNGIERVLAVLRRQLNEGLPGRVMLHAPTGAGKTGMAIQITRSVMDHGARVLYVVPRQEVHKQTMRALGEVCENVWPMTAGSRRLEHNPPQIIVAMALTLGNRLATWPASAVPDVVIIDEAHYAPGNARRLMDAFPGAIFIGMSATPSRLADDSLKSMYREIVTVATVPELIADGWLAPYRLFAGESPDVEQLRKTAGEYSPSDQDVAMNNRRLELAIVEALSTIAMGRKVLLFAATKQHSRDLCRALVAYGYAAAAIDETTPDRVREQTIQALHDGKLQILLNVGLFVEGVDIPSVNSIFTVHPTTSRQKWLQEIGRGLRWHDGKTDLLICDFGDNWRRLGLPDEAHLWDLRAQPKVLGPFDCHACTFCGMVTRGLRSSCQFCGSPLRPTTGPVMDRPALIARAARRLAAQAATQRMSFAVTERPCPARYLAIPSIWKAAEALRYRKGLVLAGPGVPIGYAEWICEKFVRSQYG